MTGPAGLSQSQALDELVDFSRRLIDFCIEAAQVIKFDKQHPQHLYSVCTYGTILEVSAGTSDLLAAKQFTGIPILLRTLLDAYASFRCCVSDSNHFKAMYANFMKEKRRLLQAVSESPDNPYLKELGKTINVPEEMAGVEAVLKDLAGQGYGPLKPWAEFQKAGLEAEYQSLYWQLCMDAHNNVSALEDRHLEKKNGDYEVTFFKEENLSDTARYLDSMCGLVHDASVRLHTLLETDQVGKFTELGAALQSIRTRYPKD